eukprot:COSAG01_NODE_67697_length_266_cov_0.646707_1_plen_66_part_01
MDGAQLYGGRLWLCNRGEGRWGYPNLQGTRFAPHAASWLKALKALARQYAAAHFGAWSEGVTSAKT